jgi:DNA (cytosine-5)-methyltransferase 1
VRLLDLFCGAGGAAMGYHRAGFDVVGVDNRPQPRYPFEFHQADAMTYPLAGFDVIHASPPCQDHSPLRSVAGEHGTGWMLPTTRDRLSAQPLPWVIENVAAADARADFMLCGTMFGLRTYRHRRFEIDPRIPALFMVPEHPRHKAPAPTRKRVEAWANGAFISATGHAGSFYGPAGLGIDWMIGEELSQAIPPAYTEYIGCQLLKVLERIER